MTLVIARITILAALAAGFAPADNRLYRNFLTTAARYKASAGRLDDRVVTEEDLGELLEPLSRSLPGRAGSGGSRCRGLRFPSNST